MGLEGKLEEALEHNRFIQQGNDNREAYCQSLQAEKRNIVELQRQTQHALSLAHTELQQLRKENAQVLQKLKQSKREHSETLMDVDKLQRTLDKLTEAFEGSEKQ